MTIRAYGVILGEGRISTILTAPLCKSWVPSANAKGMLRNGRPGPSTSAKGMLRRGRHPRRERWLIVKGRRYQSSLAAARYESDA